MGGGLSLSLALSLPFPKSAYAASLTPPVNKVISSFKFTSFSATGGLGSDKSSSNISLNKEMSLNESRSLKTIQTADKTSKFGSSQSLVFGTPLAFVKNLQMSLRSVKTLGEAQS